MRRTLALALSLALATVLVPQGASAAPFRFINGVASGDVTKRTALLWAQTNQRARVLAEVSLNRRFTRIVETVRARAKPRNDFTVEVQARGLRPGTKYWYRFVGPRGRTSNVGMFRTAPRGGNVKFVYSGDSDTTRGAETHRREVADVLAAMRKERPDVFLWGGDTVYTDSNVGGAPAFTLDQYRAKYRESRSLAAVRRMLRSTSVIPFWDDHEVLNDYAGDLASDPPMPFPPGLTVGQIQRGQRAFLEYLPARDRPGNSFRAYRRLRWGKVDIFVLDVRSFRTSPLATLVACDIDPGAALVPDLAPTLPQAIRDLFAGAVPSLGNPVDPACLAAISDPGATMLGAQQKQWLKNGLQASKAPMKIIVTAVPIMEIFANPYDRWEGYAAERMELLNHIENNVSGKVAFLATDTHATLAHDVCRSTFPSCDDTGVDEVVAGPMGTDTFGEQIDDVTGVPGLQDDVAAFFVATLGMVCVDLDQISYGVVQYNASANTLTIRPRAPDTPATNICPAPIVI